MPTSRATATARCSCSCSCRSPSRSRRRRATSTIAVTIAIQGLTLITALWTSDMPRRLVRTATIIVIVALVASLLALLSGEGGSTDGVRLIQVLLVALVPVVDGARDADPDPHRGGDGAGDPRGADDLSPDRHDVRDPRRGRERPDERVVLHAGRQRGPGVLCLLLVHHHLDRRLRRPDPDPRSSEGADDPRVRPRPDLPRHGRIAGGRRVRTRASRRRAPGRRPSNTSAAGPAATGFSRHFIRAPVEFYGPSRRVLTDS